MVTLKEYKAYLKVKRFIDGHDESEIILSLMGDNKYVPLIIKSDDADPFPTNDLQLWDTSNPHFACVEHSGYILHSFSPALL